MAESAGSGLVVSTRPIDGVDVEVRKQVLYLAVGWNPDQELPPFEGVVGHRELARYHEGWGRQGDLGVVAEVDGDFAGAAFCRLFADDDHGHGYVDEETPELAIAVVPKYRGLGLGTKLMGLLAEQARAAGIEALSLSVDAENPALRLYERLGYREISRDDQRGVRMILDLS